MSAIKKTCKNHDSYTYSGKEMSPLGMGYTAEAEEVGTVMEGRDKTMWMVGIKNGVRVWIRVPTQVAATVLKPALNKEEPVIPEEEITVAEPPPKKKVAVKKVAVVVDEKKEDEVEVPPPAPKKKAVKKVAEKKEEEAVVPQPVVVEKKKAVKKVAPPVAEKKEEEAPVAAEVKKEKKAPTAFNIYMSYRTNQLKTEKPEMDHKERFKQATADWKVLTDDEKKAALEAAKAWSDAQ